MQRKTALGPRGEAFGLDPRPGIQATVRLGDVLATGGSGQVAVSLIEMVSKAEGATTSPAPTRTARV
jgi:hypothetical protein